MVELFGVRGTITCPSRARQFMRWEASGQVQALHCVPPLQAVPACTCLFACSVLYVIELFGLRGCDPRGQGRACVGSLLAVTALHRASLSQAVPACCSGTVKLALMGPIIAQFLLRCVWQHRRKCQPIDTVLTHIVFQMQGSKGNSTTVKTTLLDQIE